MEYRIVTNGYKFKVQYEDDYGHWATFGCTMFDTLEEAETVVKHGEILDERMRAPWVPVDEK